MDGEKCVPGTVVGMKFIPLAQSVQFGGEYGRLGWRPGASRRHRISPRSGHDSRGAKSRMARVCAGPPSGGSCTQSRRGNPRVWYFTDRAHDGRRVIRVGSGRLPGVQVGAQCQVPPRREPAHDFLSGAVVTGHVVDDHHAAARATLQRAR